MATIEEMKTAVKMIPIPQYLHDIIVPSLNGYYGSGEGYFEGTQFERCPFHNEDTGSFKYYPETNSCYCFGCGIGGDIFALHKKFISDNTGQEPDFKTVLIELYNYSQSHDIEQHTTVQEIYQQQTLENWQTENKVGLLIIKNILNEKFRTANTDQYVVLCELEQIINNNPIHIQEVRTLLTHL